MHLDSFRLGEDPLRPQGSIFRLLKVMSHDLAASRKDSFWIVSLLMNTLKNVFKSNILMLNCLNNRAEW